MSASQSCNVLNIFQKVNVAVVTVGFHVLHLIAQLVTRILALGPISISRLPTYELMMFFIVLVTGR